MIPDSYTTMSVYFEGLNIDWLQNIYYIGHWPEYREVKIVPLLLLSYNNIDYYLQG